MDDRLPPPNVTKTDEDWRRELGDDSYHVLRKAGTERAFTGEFWDHHDEGEYICKGCGELLFTSSTKFDSGCGWPSFYDSVDKSKVIERMDTSHGMRRIEVLCGNCHGHLGHVFPDGPKPTGLRYCINSASLGFRARTMTTDD